MAQAIILARRKQAIGVYTQKKLAWAQMERLCGIEPTGNCADLPNLMVPMRTGMMPASYSRVCSALRDSGRVGLYCSEEDVEGGIPEFTLFSFEQNAIVELEEDLGEGQA